MAWLQNLAGIQNSQGPEVTGLTVSSYITLVNRPASLSFSFLNSNLGIITASSPPAIISSVN